jgi:hypothetical protein
MNADNAARPEVNSQMYKDKHMVLGLNLVALFFDVGNRKTFSGCISKGKYQTGKS